MAPNEKAIREERNADGAADGGTFDPVLFRRIMARFPAGVTVVTAYGEDGVPQGLTVSAFCSVSLSPPLDLVCVDKESTPLPAIRHSNAFTVNFLAAGHEELALRFASKDSDKFNDLTHGPPNGSAGGPVLYRDCSAHVACRIWRRVEAGDHWIFVGHVEDADLDEDPPPLVYGEQRFATWQQVIEAKQ